MEIEVDDREVIDALQRLTRHLADVRPALQDIGETLVHTTRRRFATGTGPDGRPWKPLSPVTVARKGHDRPLIGETGHLRLIRYQVDGCDAVEIGTGAGSPAPASRLNTAMASMRRRPRWNRPNR
ncbi:MAG TPA: hypothetical protein ENK62_01480 [Chromatiales bacterium]|nr:hypothetical protein [Chromatiales bacterium]